MLPPACRENLLTHELASLAAIAQGPQLCLVVEAAREGPDRTGHNLAKLGGQLYGQA